MDMIQDWMIINKIKMGDPDGVYREVFVSQLF